MPANLAAAEAVAPAGESSSPSQQSRPLPRKPATRVQIERLVEAARLGPQLGNIAMAFQRGWSGAIGNAHLPPASRVRAQQIIDQVNDEFLAREVLRAAVERGLARLESPDADAALAWWSSPLGTRFARIDSTAPSQDMQVEMARFVGDLQVKPLPQQRVERMTDLVASVGVGTFTRDTAIQTLKGLLSVMQARAAKGSAPTPTPAPDAESLEARLKPMIELVSVRTEQLVRLQWLYLYRDIPDADLDRYLEFARSPAGKAYTSALFGAIGEAVGAASTTAGERIIRAEVSATESRT